MTSPVDLLGAWWDGSVAQEAGVDAADNPYGTEGILADLWRDGWLSASVRHGLGTTSAATKKHAPADTTNSTEEPTPAKQWVSKDKLDKLVRFVRET